MNDVKNVKDRLRYIRKHVLNESQEKFAERVNISKDTISNIERGKVIPSLQNIVTIANSVGKSVDYFLSDADD